MADFTEAQIAGPQTGAPSGGGQRTVQQPQPSAAAAGLNLFSQVMPTAQQFQQRAQKRQEEANAQFINRFRQQQLGLADAVDSGAMSSREARMRMRANASQAWADNPLLADDIHSAHDQIIGTSGLGLVVKEGTEQEQLRASQRKEASEAGFIMPGMTDEDIEAVTDTFMRMKQRSSVYQFEVDAINRQKADVQLASSRQSLATGAITQQTARLNLQTKREEYQARHFGAAQADDYMDVLSRKANSLRAQVEAGTMAPEEANMILRDDWQQATQEIRRGSRGAGSEWVNNLLAPMEQLVQTTEGYLTGEINADVYSTLTDNLISRQGYMLVNEDPAAQTTLAASRLAGQGGALALASPLEGTVMNWLNKNSQEGGSTAPVFPEYTEQGGVNEQEERASGQYLHILKNTMGKLEDGSYLYGQETVEELQTNLNNLLRGFEQHEAVITNPRQLVPVMDFLADDSFGKVAERGLVSLDTEAEAGARRVLSVKFDEELRPLAAREWRNAQIATGISESVTPTISSGPGISLQPGPEAGAATGAIRPFFSNGQLRFQVAENQRGNTAVQANVRRLNDQVAKPINKYIRAAAHLENHTDYERLYTENYAQLFGDAGTGATDE